MKKFAVNLGGDAMGMVSDTITIVGEEGAGKVVVSASHGGISSAQFALVKRVAAAFFNDAGGGKDAAGSAGLDELDRYGIPSAVFDYRSASIGDGRDSWEAGVVSRANDAAARFGVASGMTVQQAAALLSAAAPAPRNAAPASRGSLLRGRLDQGGLSIVLIDSISMIKPGDAGSIVVSGSHGARVSAGFARQHPPRLAVFSDAGIGKNEAGIASLTDLEAAGIAALTVGANSARIGECLDVLANGVVSRVNAQAAKAGFAEGDSLLTAIRRLDG